MSAIDSILSSARDSLSSTRAVLLVSAGVILALISAAVVVALIRDHVTDGIVGLLGVATGFFLTVAGLKWGQSVQENSTQSDATK